MAEWRREMITKENLAKANLNIQTLPIHGKSYAMVASKVQAFRDICPSGTIETKALAVDDKRAVIQASIYDEKDHLLATGIAEERKDATQINQTSYVENCETSAVGRAFAFLGIGSEQSIASAEEVAQAIMNQVDIPEGKSALRVYCDEHKLLLADVWKEHALTKTAPNSLFYAVLAQVMKEQGE